MNEARVLIRAPRRVVWDLVCDIRRMGEWSPETQVCHWANGAEGVSPCVGALFHCRDRRGWARWSTVSVVSTYRPQEEFCFTTLRRRPTEWCFRLTECGEFVEVVESFRCLKPLTRVDRLVMWVTMGVRRRENDLLEGATTTLQRLRGAAERAAG